ncbi:MAG TPA: response regulator [Thermoanaerobaculia bacterium]|nr:response regulator [Thermoanaerobaculia bacterium]
MHPLPHPAHRLLIVDDEEAILFAMTDYFSRSGYLVDCARSRGEAEDLLASEAYSLVIADLRLDPADPRGGLALLLRARQSRGGTRGILLTAYGSTEVESELLGMGGALLLSKPRPLAQVGEAVSRLLDGLPPT